MTNAKIINKTIPVAIGNLNKLVIEPTEDTVWFVEVQDIHFNHNSAVPCIDGEGNLLAAIRSASAYAQRQSNKRLMLIGHTDTSGENAYNYELSQWRAKGIKAVLDQDEALWQSTINYKSRVCDYQTILSHLTSRHGWQCDPGIIDDKDGPKTQAAVKNFQSRAGEIYGIELQVDGIIGPQTWNAVLKVYGLLVCEQLGLSKLPTFNYEPPGFYGCGESFPLESVGINGHRSQTNRRVEFVFGYYSKIKLHPVPNTSTALTPATCVLFDQEKVSWKIIEPEIIEPVMKQFSL